MRVLAFIFACYFAVLGCLSCTEEEVRAEPDHLATIQPGPGQRSALAADWCSPFSQCHCCPGFAVPQPSVVVFVIQPTAPEAASRFRPQPTPAVLVRSLATPWQPPQVS